jgi:hypothetical protein
VETNFVQKPDGSIVGTITPSYKYSEYGVTFLGEVNTKKDIKLETTVENQFADGLKLTLTGEARGNATYATFATEFKNPKATVHAAVDFGKAAGSTVKASSVFGANGFALGLNGEYFLAASDNSELKHFNTTVSYTTKDFDATVFG